MSKNNYIDPTKLFSLLKKFVEGGPYTSDPSEGEIDLGGVGQFTEEGAFGTFPGQMEINNPFAQSAEQTMLGNTRDVGTTQDSRALIYDWQKNEENLDPYLNQLENQDKLSRKENKYYRENRLISNSTPKNLQDPYASVMQNNGGADNSSAMLNSSVTQNNGGTEKTRTQRIAEAAKAKADKDKGTIYDSEQNPETKEESDEPTSEAKQWATLMGSGLLNSPGHVSMEQGIYSGAKHLADGKTGIGAMNLGSALFKGAKSAVFGYADSEVDKETKEWYDKKKRDERNRFGSDSQYGDDNYLGGYYGKYGGTVNNGLSEFLAGGTNWTPPTEEDAVANFISSRSPNVYEGPISEKDAELLDTRYPSTSNPDFSPMLPPDAKRMRGLNQFVEGEQISDEERESIGRWRTENFLRSTYLPNNQDGQQMSETYHPSKNKIKYMENRSPRLGAMEEGGNFSESMDNYRRLFEGGGLMGNIAPGGVPQESDTDGTENYQVGQHVEFVYGNQNVSGKIKKILNGQIFI